MKIYETHIQGTIDYIQQNDQSNLYAVDPKDLVRVFSDEKKFDEQILNLASMVKRHIVRPYYTELHKNKYEEDQDY